MVLKKKLGIDKTKQKNPTVSSPKSEKCPLYNVGVSISVGVGVSFGTWTYGSQ